MIALSPGLADFFGVLSQFCTFANHHDQRKWSNALGAVGVLAAAVTAFAC